jgi:tRNA G26 N,N-dimethylase Trm1
MAQAIPSKGLARPKETRGLLDLLWQEADAPAFWVEPDRLQKAFRPPAPRRDAYLERLRAAGFTAARNHIEPQGIRTDADLAGLRAAWRG